MLLEVLHGDNAPAAIVLGRPDAIVGLGILVAREMGWRTIPLVVVAADEQAVIPDDSELTIPSAPLRAATSIE